MFSTIGGHPDGKRRANPLGKQLSMAEPDVVFGGGYYVFENIRESAQSEDCYDIYILV